MQYMLTNNNTYVTGIGYAAGSVPSACEALAHSVKNCIILPGFCDVHVHLREPGFSYKETIKTGTQAAARGGYTDVCTMPNLNPVPDNAEHFALQLEKIRTDAVIGVHPFGAITVGEKGQCLSDMAAMANDVAGFSDDGRDVEDEALMRAAMQQAHALGRMIVAHCEDSKLAAGGVIHNGAFAHAHDLPGISSESEWQPIARNIRLAAETGCALHICHISTKESVEVIRRAKAEGIDVTCETAPHYLLLSERDLQDDGRFKMNPPLRTEEDRRALIDGLRDGTIDMIATDHAPHSAEEKARGLRGSAMGIVGLETAFAALYTGLVRTGYITLEQLVECMAVAPRRRFGLPMGEDYSVWDLRRGVTVNPESFCSMGHSTPFAGHKLFGECIMTVRNGKTVWQADQNK